VYDATRWKCTTGGRERLLRYCARPPLSLERLAVLRDGRVAYELRKPWGGATHRVMTPLQFLARLAALISPPRHPLIRFYGVFAPHSSWRKSVVPEPARCRTMDVPACARTPATDGSSPAPRGLVARVPCSVPAPACSPRVQAGPVRAALLALRAPLPHIPWEELLRRTYDVDALRCPCGGRLRFIASKPKSPERSLAALWNTRRSLRQFAAGLDCDPHPTSTVRPHAIATRRRSDGRSLWIPHTPSSTRVRISRSTLMVNEQSPSIGTSGEVSL
jgi:hypothetical protein